MSDLLPSERVEVERLAGLFHATTSAYKHLFFQALVTMVAGRRPDDRVIELEALGVEMLALAWYPYTYFRVSFGLQDSTGKVLDRLEFSPEGVAVTHPGTGRALRTAICSQATPIRLKDLLRYVP